MDIANRNSGLSLDEVIDAIAPKKFLRDPFGFFSGYRAYLVFSHLNGMSDDTLAQIGVKRKDIPSIAGKQVQHQAKAA